MFFPIPGAIFRTIIVAVIDSLIFLKISQNSSRGLGSPETLDPDLDPLVLSP